MFKKKKLKCNTCGKEIEKKIGVHEMCQECFDKGVELIFS